MQKTTPISDSQPSSINSSKSLDDNTGGSASCNVAREKSLGLFDLDAIKHFCTDDAVRDILQHIDGVASEDAYTFAAKREIAHRVILWCNLAKAQGALEFQNAYIERIKKKADETAAVRAKLIVPFKYNK